MCSVEAVGSLVIWRRGLCITQDPHSPSKRLPETSKIELNFPQIRFHYLTEQ